MLSGTGSLAAEATTFYRRLAARLADKWEQPYSKTMAWWRCRLTFSLLRSVTQCIRGARSSCGNVGTHILSPRGWTWQYLSSSWTNNHCKLVHIYCKFVHFYIFIFIIVHCSNCLEYTVVSRKYAPPFATFALVRKGGYYVRGDNFSCDSALPSNRAWPHCHLLVGGGSQARDVAVREAERCSQR